MLIKKTNSVIRLALLGAVLMSGTNAYKRRRRPQTKPSETLRGRQALKGKIQARLRDPAAPPKAPPGIQQPAPQAPPGNPTDPAARPTPSTTGTPNVAPTPETVTPTPDNVTIQDPADPNFPVVERRPLPPPAQYDSSGRNY